MMNAHLLSLIVALPFCGALITTTFPRGEHTGVRAFGLSTMLLTLMFSAYAWMRFVPGEAGLQLLETTSWLPTLGVQWALGVDGVSLPLLLLTALMAPVALLASYGRIHERTRDFVAWLLILEGSVLGGMAAVDLFVFYLFWEGMLIPAFFLVGMWGGQGRRPAALKFFLYTMAGSMPLLIALLALGHLTRAEGGNITYLWPELMARLQTQPLGFIELGLFAAFALAFLVKLPVFPLHAWLPDAYAEAPVATVVMLSAVMVKLGALGLLRYAFLLFPRAATTVMPIIATLAVVGVLYGAWVAAGQHSLRRTLAYSSLSHMGLIALGLTTMAPVALGGSVLQMVNHGISTGALFVLAGLLAERAQGESFRELGGLAARYPKLATLTVVMALSSMGLPGLNGFVGEFLILLGTFTNQGLAVIVSEGQLAQAAILVLIALSIAAFITVAWHLFRANKTGRKQPLWLSCGAFVLVGAALAALSMPPIFGMPAGLLITPFLPHALSARPFTHLFLVLAVFATLGVILTAVYMLRFVSLALFGPLRPLPAGQPVSGDLNAREWLMLAPLVFLAFALGIYPTPILERAEPTVTAYAARFRLVAGWQAPHVVKAHPQSTESSP